MDSSVHGKEQLRTHFKALRKNLGASMRSDVDARIATRLTTSDLYRMAPTVLTYLSFGDEVDTRSIILNAWADGKTVAIPRCMPDEGIMQWHRIRSLEGFSRNSYGIEEPPANRSTIIDIAALDERSIAIAPGLCFDDYGMRLGYGGGYYDAFIPHFVGTTIGLCREKQLCESLREFDAVNDFDAPVDIVITEQRIINPSTPDDSGQLKE